MIRIRFVLIITILCLSSSAWGQLMDDFSDGNLTQNPAWTGDLSAYSVNAAGELQLNAPAAGSASLTLQGNIPDSAVWNLHFRLNFAPSTQNLLRIYLLADQPDLAVANGYFIEIGETGSQDALRFFRQDAGVKTLLATGQAALVATNPDIQLQVKKTVSGNWSAEAASLNGALQPQWLVSDNTYNGGPDRFFGFQCVYTSSNTTNFLFDNLSILPDLPDLTPPVLLSASAVNQQQVLAIFNEDLDAASAAFVSNYNINAGVGAPQSVFLQSDKKSLLITLNSSLSTGAYTLQSSGVKDISGNISATQSVDFQYVSIELAEQFDILINEIMADPGPSVGLPEGEWLEFYNRSDKIIDLATLRIDGSGSPLPLPAHLLYPGKYAVITIAANVAALQAFAGDTVLTSPLSSTALNNDSDVLTLTNATGALIDRVAYSLDWHTEEDKKDGGWSLERINPDLPCLDAENWRSCPVTPGGTPGAVNASFAATSDTQQPTLLKIVPESNSQLLLTFSEALDPVTAVDVDAYQFIPARNIQSVESVEGGSQIRLTLSEALQTAVVYALLVRNSVADCSGNAFVETDTFYIGLPEKPGFQDVVINEILFNPPTGGSRYVELYNRSQKIFRWSEFFIANFNFGANVQAVTTDRLLLPGHYYVLTEDRGFVLDRYRNIIENDVLDQDLPSLSDGSGNFTLYWSQGGQTRTIDSLDYVDDWHNALYSTSDRDGVALERIRAGSPTNDASNWTSASPRLTGAAGTPTLPNSQRLNEAGASGDELLLLAAERLSPDGDGYEDFLEIRYQLPAEGYGASMTVFDAGGIPIKRLVRQQLVGTEGTLRWDGDSDDGNRVRSGIYVLYLEIFSPTGDVKNIKRSVSVVQRF